MTASSPPAAAPIPTFIDNPHAPEVFAEGVWGFLINQGNVHMTLTALRADHSQQPAPINRAVIGRLVMPIFGAQSLATALYDFLKTRGFDPAAPLPGQTVQ